MHVNAANDEPRRWSGYRFINHARVQVLVLCPLLGWGGGVSIPFRSETHTLVRKGKHVETLSLNLGGDQRNHRCRLLCHLKTCHVLFLVNVSFGTLSDEVPKQRFCQVRKLLFISHRGYCCCIILYIIYIYIYIRVISSKSSLQR